MLESPTPGRLVSFRLTDVPRELRVRAARAARPSTAHVDALNDAADRLFATLLGGDRDELLAVAEEPSDRVYRVTEQAWRRVMG